MQRSIHHVLLDGYELHAWALEMVLVQIASCPINLLPDANPLCLDTMRRHHHLLHFLHRIQYLDQPESDSSYQ